MSAINLKQFEVSFTEAEYKQFLDENVVLTEEGYRKLSGDLQKAQVEATAGMSSMEQIDALEKAHKDYSNLVKKQIQVTRDGKTFTKTVYVKRYEGNLHGHGGDDKKAEAVYAYNRWKKYMSKEKAHEKVERLFGKEIADYVSTYADIDKNIRSLSESRKKAAVNVEDKDKTIPETSMGDMQFDSMELAEKHRDGAAKSGSLSLLRMKSGKYMVTTNNRASKFEAQGEGEIIDDTGKTNKPVKGTIVSDSKGSATIKRVHKPKEGTPFYGKEDYLIDIERSDGKESIYQPLSRFTIGDVKKSYDADLMKAFDVLGINKADA